MVYDKYRKLPQKSYGGKLEYKTYRIKSPIKSFRDLEVYKNTTQLAAEIFQIKIPHQTNTLEKEIEILQGLVKPIPKLIAESYGDKFSNVPLALGKLEKAMQLISNVITKIDFLIASFDEQEIKETLNNLLKRYQIQRRKILNLKRAWERVFAK